MIEDNNSSKDYILVEGDNMEVSVVSTEDNHSDAGNKQNKSNWRYVAVVIIIMTIVMAGIFAWIGYDRYFNLGVPISRQPNENITLLKKQMNSNISVKPGVTLTSDTILGVAMDFYRLEGLHGTLTTSKPDTTDTSVYLYMRSTDYLADGTPLGATVIDGQELKSVKDRRMAYVAMAGKGTVIGISRSNKVKDFVEENKGSFFRQFILLSNGVIPRNFHLHGKVERRALGRIDNKLYFISTRNKETMWDFADALREYGLVDAVYITGGNDRTFYRTADGESHAIGSDTTFSQKAIWLVFKNN